MTATEFAASAKVAAEVADRVFPVAVALVERYAPSAPSPIQDEAAFRTASWLVRAPIGYLESTLGDRSYEVVRPGSTGALRASGALALISPWKVRRAGVIGGVAADPEPTTAPPRVFHVAAAWIPSAVNLANPYPQQDQFGELVTGLEADFEDGITSPGYAAWWIEDRTPGTPVTVQSVWVLGGAAAFTDDWPVAYSLAGRHGHVWVASSRLIAPSDGDSVRVTLQ